MPRLSSAFTLAAAATTATTAATAAPEPTRYDGHQVLRLQFPSSTAVLRTVDACENTEGCNMWDVRALTADMSVSPAAMGTIKPAIYASNATTQVWMRDLQKVIEEVAAMKGFGLDPFFNNYQRFAEIQRKAQEIATLNPEVARYEPSIGKSSQGRDIFALYIGNANPGTNRAVYIQGGMHAREWVSHTTVMWIIDQMVTSTDPVVVNLLRQMTFIFVPMLNPDGYEFCHTNTRLWRKSRNSNAGSTCIGTDLNRNFADHWGGGGSSPSACQDTYRGTVAFDTPEAASVETLLMTTVRNAGLDLIAGIDFHAYGQLILRPYGWQLPNAGTPPNDAELKTVGDRMRDTIRTVSGMRYTSEHAAELYVAAGGADDWFYSTATNGKMGYTIELRDEGQYGFVLPANQIIPTGTEAYAAFLELAKHALSRP